MKIPPNRRKTAYSSLRRIAKRLGLRFERRRSDRQATGIVDRLDSDAGR